MSHADLLANATDTLQATSESPRLDAEVLLRHVTSLDRTGLFVALRDDAADDVARRFLALVERRATGMPVAYLTGTREFMGLSFAVDERVLVPRPETELLVAWALGVLPRLASPVRAVDVGAGSGAIAVALATLARVPVEVTAVEPSAGAREVIARNRDALVPADRRAAFRIVDDDLLAETPGPFGLVLANLPYLTPAQIAASADLAAEPRLALDGGPDGLDPIRRLIPQLPNRLAPTFAVALELDPSQAERVVVMLEGALPNAEVSIIRDYAGLDRHVVATYLDG